MNVPTNRSFLRSSVFDKVYLETYGYSEKDLLLELNNLCNSIQAITFDNEEDYTIT